MKKTLLTTAAIAVLSTSAFAGEAGKMYIIGNGGYQFSSYKNNLLGDTDAKCLKGLGGSVGFGYNLSDDVRADITFNFSRGRAEQKANTASEIAYNSDGTPTTLAAGEVEVTDKRTNMGLMFNGYYDFRNSSAFTPYIMGGLGANRSNVELEFAGKDSNGTDKDFTIKSDDELTSGLSFAFQGGLGALYEMSKGVFLDVNYKVLGYEAKPEFKFDKETFKFGGKDYKKDTPYTIESKYVFNNTISAGVMFTF